MLNTIALAVMLMGFMYGNYFEYFFNILIALTFYHTKTFKWLAKITWEKQNKNDISKIDEQKNWMTGKAKNQVTSSKKGHCGLWLSPLPQQIEEVVRFLTRVSLLKPTDYWPDFAEGIVPRWRVATSYCTYTDVSSSPACKTNFSFLGENIFP